MGALGRGRVRDERRPNVQVPLNTPAVCVCVVEYAHAMPVQLMYEHEAVSMIGPCCHVTSFQLTRRSPFDRMCKFRTVFIG